MFPSRFKKGWVKGSSAEEVSINHTKANNARLDKHVSRALSVGKDVHLFQCVECGEEQLYTELGRLVNPTRRAKYPQTRGKTGKLVLCRNQEFEHRILYVAGRKNAKPQQFLEYMGPKGPEDFGFSTSDEDDEEAAVPQVQELQGSGGEDVPIEEAGFPEHVLHRLNHKFVEAGFPGSGGEGQNISEGAQEIPQTRELVPAPRSRIRKFFLEPLDKEREAPLSENPLWMGAVPEQDSEDDDQSQDDVLLWTSQEVKRP